MLEEHIEELRAQAERTTPNVTTYIQINPQTGKKETYILPSTGGTGTGHSRVESCAEQILENETKLGILKQKKQHLTAYIDSIPDSLKRQIFILRFKRGLSWKQVANKIGGRNTEDGVQKQVYRYIEKT